MDEQIPVDVIFLLTDTLCDVFWYKQELRRFLSTVEIPDAIRKETHLILYDRTKRAAIDYLFDKLMQLPQNAGYRTIARILDLMVNWSRFDGAADTVRARQSVAALNERMSRYREEVRRSKEEDEVTRKSRQAEERLTKKRILVDQFYDLFRSQSPQQRGRDLEILLHGLFRLSGLETQESFSLQGEQIDGAFVFEGIHYLVEAKWVSSRVSPDEVAWFQTKINRKLSGTRGLMIAVEGYTDEAIRTARDSRCVILMDGDDLHHVLSPEIDLDFVELLRKKIAAFAREGTPLLHARELKA